MRDERKEVQYDDEGCLQKFDICIADLGEIEDGDCTLAKIRPVVILQSNSLNNEKTSTYIVAGIKSAHEYTIDTKEKAEKFVAEKRKVGRIYVPIRRRYGAEYFTFIEISQLRMLPAIKVQRFVGRINNQELKDRINRAMMELLFGNDELNIYEEKEEKTEISVEPKEPELVETENKKSKKKEKGNTSFPMGFSNYYRLYKENKLTVNQISKKIGKSRGTTYYYIKRYEESHPEIAKLY